MKNKKGGKRTKRTKTLSVDNFFLREEGQQYAVVEKMMGDCRVQLVTEDKETVTGIIRGNMRKRTWVSPGMYVIATPREFEQGKMDIVHVYPLDQMNLLERYCTIRREDEEIEEVEFCEIDDI